MYVDANAAKGTDATLESTIAAWVIDPESF
jgi:hypothetical protein